jgi:hypothetical protein
MIAPHFGAINWTRTIERVQARSPMLGACLHACPIKEFDPEARAVYLYLPPITPIFDGLLLDPANLRIIEIEARACGINTVQISNHARRT